MKKSNIQLHTKDYNTGSTLCQVYNPELINKGLTRGLDI